MILLKYAGERKVWLVSDEQDDEHDEEVSVSEEDEDEEALKDWEKVDEIDEDYVIVDDYSSQLEDDLKIIQRKVDVCADCILLSVQVHVPHLVNK